MASRITSTVRWNSSPHPISDIRDWSETGRLELRPDFQRREVWSASARIMLMDTILRSIPMPKIFLANSIREGKTYRVVIDGQQRLSAILAFLRDEFSLEAPFIGEEKGKRFSELDQEIQDHFVGYQIDFNEAIKPSEDEVREVYARVNKYTVPLTKQELRRSDFPGDFLTVSEELAVNEYLDRIRLFSAASRRRYADVEYVSELLVGMIDGIQDKKNTLDHFYIEFTKWEESQKNKIIDRFHHIIQQIEIIFENTQLPIWETRFRQKADFYTLFLVVDSFVSDGKTVDREKLEPLQDDLMILQEYIRPESEIEICSEYAIKCVSQANSASSRKWRYKFIKSIFTGTYNSDINDMDEEYRNMLYKLKKGLDNHHFYLAGWCSGDSDEITNRCKVCDQELIFDNDNFDKSLIAWNRSDDVYQISNAHWIHPSCSKSAHWIILKRPNND